jgi:SAM-dependent methyltransferase
MVGLGVGSVATYIKPGDSLKIYEINPAVVDIARSHFSFLEDSAADVDVVLGDARLSLEREPPQAYDVFILDAFSSDAIPVHLLTREAFETYLEHLAPDGVIAVLISSWHFDFEPLLTRMADEFGLQSALVSIPSGDLEDWGSRWMIMTRNERFMSQGRIRFSAQQSPRGERDVRLWTDDFSSPFQLLK